MEILSFPKTKPIRLSSKDMQVLRQRVMERDGWVCQLCGVSVADFYPDWHPKKAELMHLQSRGAGGDDSEANTQCACKRCHSESHNAGGKPVPAKTLPKVD